MIPLELPAYQKKENWGAAETFYQLVRALAGPSAAAGIQRGPAGARCNLLGPTALGFRHRDDITEITGLLDRIGHRCRRGGADGRQPRRSRPAGRSGFQRRALPGNRQTPPRRWLQRTFRQPTAKTVPIGVGATRDFIAEVARPRRASTRAPVLAAEASRLPWYSQLGRQRPT